MIGISLLAEKGFMRFALLRFLSFVGMQVKNDALICRIKAKMV